MSSESITNGIDHSSALFSLRYLETLNLAYNSLNSTPIPSNVGDLTNLRYLNLSNSGFSGQIPVGLSLLARLVTLDLSTLYFPGTRSLQIENPNLSTLIGNLSGVKELHLDGVNMSANGYQWARTISSSMPYLSKLSLSNCYLSGPIDPSLRNLELLSEINLSNNNLSSPVPDFFAYLPSLTVLRFSSSKFELERDVSGEHFTTGTNTGDSEFGNLASNTLLNGSLTDFPENGSLRNLELSFTSFSGILPESIGNLIELRRIEIPGCHFTGPIPNSLATLSQLVYLDFSLNNFSGPIPSFQGSKNLTYVDLSHNALTDLCRPRSIAYQFSSAFFVVVVSRSSSSLNNGARSPIVALVAVKSSSHSRPSRRRRQILVPVIHLCFTPSSLSTNLRFRSIHLRHSASSSSSKPFISVVRFISVVLHPRPRHILVTFETHCRQSPLFASIHLKIQLSNNKFGGQVTGHSNESLSPLDTLDLSSNILEVDISSSSSFPQLNVLSLASCNLQKFPLLMNHSRITHLDLSNNQIPGIIPNWIWNVGNRSLAYSSLGHLNLSCNLLVGLQNEYIMPSLGVLDLHSNKLSGDIPLPPETAIYVDYSSNNFNTSIPGEIGKGISFANFFSLANNALSGPIPQSICNGSYLQDKVTVTQKGLVIELVKILTLFTAIDFSNNRFEGEIPDTIGALRALYVLNLSRNALSGLNTCCNEVEPASPALDGMQSYTEVDDEINWVYIIATLGYTVGFGVIVGPLLYSKRWRQCYYKPVDRVTARILHHRE
ncbi:hypothetical protein RHMOL_Rhmol05G0305600 [Rhododendron molle]|uniref:Uncharacterized protein n=1 Tax=Rhododendron molle TaxID=49168 RepID=A0ACC0NX17_RHOML|nr:hypothetical protein RHMOL_Rhmol05G0305600 [Rhododendron molle]